MISINVMEPYLKVKSKISIMQKDHARHPEEHTNLSTTSHISHKVYFRLTQTDATMSPLVPTDIGNRTAGSIFGNPQGYHDEQGSIICLISE